jgi:hypothetical protein
MVTASSAGLFAWLHCISPIAMRRLDLISQISSLRRFLASKSMSGFVEAAHRRPALPIFGSSVVQCTILYFRLLGVAIFRRFRYRFICSFDSLQPLPVAGWYGSAFQRCIACLSGFEDEEKTHLGALMKACGIKVCYLRLNSRYIG